MRGNTDGNYHRANRKRIQNLEGNDDNLALGSTSCPRTLQSQYPRPSSPQMSTHIPQHSNQPRYCNIAIPRWSKATNILIEKDPGTPNINRLRIIHLFEADFNFFLKLQWGHRLVRHADKFNLLNNGQHGSIPGHTTMDPIMLIQFTTDLSRLLKANRARFDNDASACYDRIIVALGMLAARRLGMPENAIKTHANASSS